MKKILVIIMVLSGISVYANDFKCDTVYSIEKKAISFNKEVESVKHYIGSTEITDKQELIAFSHRITTVITFKDGSFITETPIKNMNDECKILVQEYSKK